MPRPPSKRHAAPGTVRIIGGRWKRTPLPVADLPGLRPTPDRVRETVFNWLVHAFGDLADRSVLDLYAGSGALGFEAASRGAARVVLVEHHPAAAAALRATQTKLAATTVEVVGGDALASVKRFGAAGQRFDVVFLDPPFADDALEQALAAVSTLVTPSGMIYVESGSALADEATARLGFESYRADRAGDVFYHLLQRKKKSDEETT